jgi:ATP-dependent Clp protease ATP-binding subunit ClpC
MVIVALANKSPVCVATLPRIDDVVVFNTLEKEHINLIIDIELEKLIDRIKDLGYTLKLSKKAKDFIADKGFDQQYGARPLKRAIQKYIEDALAEEIITSKIHEGDIISMDIEKDATELSIKIKTSEKPTKS